jgi:hypothetical protein
MNRRFDQLDLWHGTINRRLDHIEKVTSAVNFQVAGMSKAIGDGQRLTSELAATQMAQQRAIDDLAVRVQALERKREP